jgi:GT2 family glycosyltransferase
MLATLESDPRIGIVGPTLWQGDRLISAGGRDIALYAATHLQPSQRPEGLLDVDYVSGTVALVGRRVFETVGMLDEDYFFGGELADLCLRARQRGFRCVTDARATASHDLDRSSKIRESLHVYYVFRNRYLYIRKHYPRQRRRLQIVWTIRGLGSILIALAKGNRRRARSIGLGLVDGLKGRFGGQNDRVLT